MEQINYEVKEEVKKSINVLTEQINKLSSHFSH